MLLYCLISLMFLTHVTCLAQDITPYKYPTSSIHEIIYEVPSSSRFTIQRLNASMPELVYYLSVPKVTSFPIAILCGGSSLKNNIVSIIHFHRYFLKEFIDLNSAVLTIEQCGVDGKKIEVSEFITHYTRSNRLQDHRTLIDYLKLYPPKGWNGKLIFLGVSEGGPIVTSLTAEYSDITLATMNWCGAGDWSWREELWLFIENIQTNAPWHMKLRVLLPPWLPFSPHFPVPKTRYEYDKIMDHALKNRDVTQEFMGMSYKYHADALMYPLPDYSKLRTPFLVVAGVQDTIIQSSDAFVSKAIEQGVKITYIRVADMDHYIRLRPDIIQQSFEWLTHQLVRQL